MKKGINIAMGAMLCTVVGSCTGEKPKSDTAEQAISKKEEVVETKVISTSEDGQPVYEHDYIVKVGDLAPEFDIELISGEKVSLSSLRGKTVMLQFTATWCRVCREEIPEIESQIWQKYKDNENFMLIAVDRDEPLDVVRGFVDKIGANYPFGLDPEAGIFAKYALKQSGITRNVIINQAGEIEFLTRLYDKDEFALMCNKIDELVNAK